MPLPVMQSAKPALLGIFSEEFDEEVARWGWPRFRADQVRDWVYGKLVDRVELMTNLSLGDRKTLGDKVKIASGVIATRQLSEDGTLKLLMSWPDGSSAETVMIPDGERQTACVSSQVGCPVGCKFCASGINGMKGNLTAGQIVEQVFRLNQMLLDGLGFGGEGLKKTGDRRSGLGFFPLPDP